MSENSDFIPYQNRETHWGETQHRPRIPNVPTVLPSDIPDAFLSALLLRVQYEEAMQKLDHLDEEAKYVVWKENSISLAAWSGRVDEAVKSRAKEILEDEVREYSREMENKFPMFLPEVPKSN